MNLADVMDEIAERLKVIDGLRTFGWPPGTIVPPAAIVYFPDEYTYDETYGRGMDRMTLPVTVAVSKADLRSARDRLAQYVDGSGDSSFKAVLESGTYTAFDAVRVMGAEIGEATIGGTEYYGATFDLDIVGSGS